MCHSGFHACHWCEQTFYNSPGINRTIHGDYRRWLPADHPWRTRRSWGKPEHELPPDPRTDASIKRDGHAADEYKGFSKYHPVRNTGVKRACALYWVPMFDMVWDLCLDHMHVCKNFIIKQIKLLKGERAPQHRPKLTSAQNDTIEMQVAKIRYSIFGYLTGICLPVNLPIILQVFLPVILPVNSLNILCQAMGKSLRSLR